MRRINKLILTACGYAILMLTLFYAFASISQFVSKSIPPQKFALILFFGFIIALAEFMYEELKLKKIYKSLIHYAVLLVAFCVIFIVSGNISSSRPSAIFASIVIFTAAYFAILALVHFARKAINSADDKLDKREANKTPKEKSKGSYKSIYSDGD